MTAPDALKAELEIEAKTDGSYLRKGPSGPLASWLRTLNLSTSKAPLGKDASDTLGSWAFFPVEALFGTSPALYHRLFDETGKEPEWANQSGSSNPPVEDDASGAVPAASHRLGLIGQQVFRLVNQKSAENCKFELILQSRQDLKIIDIRITGPAESLESPPPFAYTGYWSDNPADNHSINLTAVAALWHNPAYRKGALSWLKGSGASFFLEFPPLAHFELVLAGNAQRRATASGNAWTLDLVVTIRLPHFLEESANSIAVVTAIPSLLALESPLSAKWKELRKSLSKRDGALKSPIISRVFRKKVGDESEQPRVFLEQLLLDSKHPKPKTLLIASPHLRAAVEKMSELWADQSLRNVLLIAPPGSGKEVLAEFLHAGSVFFGQERALLRAWADAKHFWDRPVDWVEFSEWERAGTSIAEVSLAGTKDITTVQRIVFGQVRQFPNEKCAKEERAVPIGRRTDLYWVGGLVRDARGTTVFLDEIDKAEPEIRSALLRFLENDEIYPSGSPRPLRLDQLEDLLKDLSEGRERRRLKTRLLFAGSKPRKEILGSAPPDFWTRMHRIIEIPHPFEIPDAEERTRCIQEYVILFLYRAVQNKFKGKAEVDGPYKTFDEILGHILSGKADEASASVSRLGNTLSKVESPDGYPFFYLNSERITNISRFVASFLVRFSPSALSVRNLRSIIKQLDYRIELWVDQGIDLLATQDPGGAFSSKEGSIEDKERQFNRAWIWGNLHDISLSLLR